MDQRVSLITLVSDDLERSRAFYAGLGWDVAVQNEILLVFDLLGQSLGFYLRDNLAADMGLAPEELRVGGVTLAHNVAERADVAVVVEQARVAGAQVLRDAHEVFWGGVVGFFRDPDGHIWEVSWNPHSTLREDGAFRWAGYGPLDSAEGDA